MRLLLRWFARSAPLTFLSSFRLLLAVFSSYRRLLSVTFTVSARLSPQKLTAESLGIRASPARLLRTPLERARNSVRSPFEEPVT